MLLWILTGCHENGEDAKAPWILRGVVDGSRLDPQPSKRTNHLRGQAFTVARGNDVPRDNEQTRVWVCLDGRFKVAEHHTIVGHDLGEGRGGEGRGGEGRGGEGRYIKWSGYSVAQVVDFCLSTSWLLCEECRAPVLPGGVGGRNALARLLFPLDMNN